MNMRTNHTTDIPWYGWLAVIVIVFTQGIWLFTDARKRNARYWFWGIWGLTTFPMPTLLYLIFVRKVFARKKKE